MEMSIIAELEELRFENKELKKTIEKQQEVIRNLLNKIET